MKKILFIVICVVLASCSSTNAIYNTEQLKKITTIAYTTPVFDAETNASNSKRIQGFKKYINFGLDSLYTIDAKRYNISKKISLKEANKTYVENLFSVDINEKVTLPNELKTLLSNSSEKHVMFLSFKPKLGYAFGRFEIIKSTQMKTLVVEVATGNIIFSNTFSSFNNGISKQLVENIQRMHSKLKK